MKTNAIIMPLLLGVARRRPPNNVTMKKEFNKLELPASYANSTDGFVSMGFDFGAPKTQMLVYRAGRIYSVQTRKSSFVQLSWKMFLDFPYLKIHSKSEYETEILMKRKLKGV